jgi:predicted GNAT family acetyltransferase
MPEVQVRDNPEQQRFEAYVDGRLAGFSEYVADGDGLDIVHTEVDDAFEGQGVGSTLVRGALDAVRGERVRVVAQCPFVKSYLDEHQEYADLVG